MKNPNLSLVFEIIITMESSGSEFMCVDSSFLRVSRVLVLSSTGVRGSSSSSFTRIVFVLIGGGIVEKASCDKVTIPFIPKFSASIALTVWHKSPIIKIEIG